MRPFAALLLPATVAATLLLAGASLAHAQAGEARGAVYDSASGRPVSGAVVMALDPLGATLSRVITGERGQFRLPLADAAMLIRVIRLGFAPTTTRLPLLRIGITELDFKLSTVPRALEAMEVTAARGCPSRTDRADAFALLDQARAGLLATVVARERQPAQLRVVRFERYLDLDGIEIERQRVQVDSSRNATTSFNAVRNAVDFIDRGFRTGVTGQYTYFGPDADVLLDERFQNGYCFRVATADSTRPSQVGLRFSPAGKREGRVDIDGTLWIDTAARALHDIEFRYLGIEALGEAFNAGGRVGFRTMPSGVPFIDQWALRLVGSPDTTVTDAGTSSQVYAVREIGGELAEARWPDGTTWTAPLSTLHVTAITSDGTPAPNVHFNLRDTDYRFVSDTNGRATLPFLLPGPYAVVVDDPQLKTIGLQIPTEQRIVAQRASSALVRVVVPSTTLHVAAMCDRATAATPNEAWLVARVVASDGKPVPGARWRVSQADGSRWRVVSDNGITGSNGVVTLCKGLTRGGSVELAAWRDPKDAIRVQRLLEDPINVLTVRLPTAAPVIGAVATAATGTATITVAGSVRDSSTGALVPDARVTFLGTPFEGATDSTGTFIVGGLPVGEHTVEVSTPALDSIGAAARTAVTLSASSAPLSLFVPSFAAVISAACGSPNLSAFVIGRVSTRGTALPAGLRVVAEWPDVSIEPAAESPRAARVAFMQTPLETNGTYRLCGLPTGTPLTLRTESDSSTTWASGPLAVKLDTARRFARADLRLDSVVVSFASFSGTVVSDTVGAPIENAEVTITDLERTVLTNRSGAFRVSDIPPGPHIVAIKRVGFAPTITTIDFASNRAVEQRWLLTRATTLATVTVSADGVPIEFDERRKSGIGRFMAREDLEKQRGRRLGDALTQVTGFGAASQAAGHAWVVGRRAPTHLLPNTGGRSCGSATVATKGLLGAPPPCTFDKDDLRNQGFYCPTASDQAQGIRACACFAQVYLDGRLLNTSRPTEPFDANTLPVEDLVGVEFYASAASTPGRYSSPNAICGVMLVWTKRR